MFVIPAPDLRPAQAGLRRVETWEPRDSINVAIKHPNLRRATVIPAKAGIQGIRRVLDFPIHRRMTYLIAGLIVYG